jgi:N-acetylmuramoyl-L-alanine amidase
MRRNIKYLVIHSTFTEYDVELSEKQIINSHMLSPPHGKGWSKVGYSDVIHLDGTISNFTPFNEDGRVEEWKLSHDGEDIHSLSRHIAYVGGVSKDGFNSENTMTDEQRITFDTYLKYMVRRYPDLLIVGHGQLTGKSCPGFNIPSYCEGINIPNKNILK